MAAEHVPVLLVETIAGFALKPDATCVDGTLGGGGHAEALLEATAPAGRLLGLDADPAAIERCQGRLARFGERVVLCQGSFRRLMEIAAEAGVTAADAAGIQFSDRRAAGHANGSGLAAHGGRDRQHVAAGSVG
jgi:16S rRNA (cytosine1402-N4)-methyltransferase